MPQGWDTCHSFHEPWKICPGPHKGDGLDRKSIRRLESRSGKATSDILSELRVEDVSVCPCRSVLSRCRVQCWYVRLLPMLRGDGVL